MAETADIARFEYTENEFVVTPRCNFFQADLDLLERPLLDELPRRENEWLTFIMNFEFCQKIDADGILFILRLYDLLQAKDHEFIIINCNDRIMRSLKLFRLDKSFPI